MEIDTALESEKRQKGKGFTGALGEWAAQGPPSVSPPTCKVPWLGILTRAQNVGAYSYGSSLNCKQVPIEVKKALIDQVFAWTYLQWDWGGGVFLSSLKNLGKEYDESEFHVPSSRSR